MSSETNKAERLKAKFADLVSRLKMLNETVASPSSKAELESCISSLAICQKELKEQEIRLEACRNQKNKYH